MFNLNKSYSLLLYITAALFCLTFFFSCWKDPKSYEISGKLENVNGNCFYMSYEVGDSILVDSISVNEEGEFSHKGIIDTLTEFSLYFNQNTKSSYVLINKGWNIQLEGDVCFPDLIKIKGGDVNDDLTAFKNENKELLKSRAEILNQAEETNADNDSLVMKDYVVELKNINFELSNIAANYIKNHPEKIASVMLINTFFKDETSIPRLDENLALLKGKAADFHLTADLKYFRDKVKMSVIGATAPNFQLKDARDKEIQLIDYRNKYVLLSFISSSCNVCKEEKRDAIKIYNKLKKEKKNIEFLTIVKDIEDEPLENISDSIKWVLLPVKGGWSEKTFDSYNIREIPYNILISPTGIILDRDIHIQTVPTRLNEFIGKNKTQTF